MTWRYRLYGLETESEIDLGPLPPGDPTAPVELAIVTGAVPAVAGTNGEWFEFRGSAAIIDLKPSGRFMVERGARIAVDGVEAGLAALRWRLLGIAFGAVFHQRGILPLHATAVRIGAKNIGLVGASGAGKSTLAAFLHRRGHGLLIDDVCAVVPGVPGPVVVEPGNGLLRLWDDAMAALGKGGGERLDPAYAKFEHHSPAPRDRVALDALVELAEGEALDATFFDAPARLACALRHSYCRDLMIGLGGKGRNFRQCAAIAAALPMLRLSRPRGFDHFDAVMDALEREAERL